MVKIVLIGDVHGKFEKLDEVLTLESPFDFFLSVGDVGTLDDVIPQNIHLIDKWKNGYMVKGTHDNVQFFNSLSNYKEIQGVKIAAINGSIKTRTFMRDSFESLLYLSHLKQIDILVTHQPPRGIFENKGERALNSLLRYIKPRIMISGHIHRNKVISTKDTFYFSLPLITRGYGVAYFENGVLKNLEQILRSGKKVIRV